MSHVAVARALILLRYIVDHPDGLSIREASRNLGYSPATVQKLINALNAQGYVVQDKSTERYHLGAEAVQLGLTALSRLEIRRIAHPHLEALSRESGETVFLGIARDNHAIYIDKVVSAQPIRMDAPLGVNRPYNCTAVGKVLLAGLPDEELERLAADGAFEQRTERSVSEAEALRTEIAQVRVQGWARDDEEYISGAGCVAAPVHDHEGQVIAALTVSGPAERIRRKFDHLVAQVKARAAAISEEMGYRSSHA
jgi:DNA-binding IclR family transcriptional regulator